MNADNLTIAVVVPCYNEAEMLPISVPKIIEVLDAAIAQHLISADSYLLCCDDGSQDATWAVIERLHAQSDMVKGISLAQNRGHQFALMAGLMEAMDHCDAAVTIDADLQDDPWAIIDMVKKYREGYEIVCGVRNNRKADSWFKRVTAHAFYSMQKRMGINSVYDHADYRLMSNDALRILAQYPERNLFLRGVIAQIGLKSTTVEYARGKRAKGVSKYSLRKMLGLSIDGITSFSVYPIRIIFFVGVIFLVMAIAMSIYAIIAHIQGNTIPGWTSMMISLWFMGSLILIGLGIIGEYIGKIYIEVKRRPQYSVIRRT